MKSWVTLPATPSLFWDKEFLDAYLAKGKNLRCSMPGASYYLKMYVSVSINKHIFEKSFLIYTGTKKSWKIFLDILVKYIIEQVGIKKYVLLTNITLKRSKPPSQIMYVPKHIIRRPSTKNFMNLGSDLNSKEQYLMLNTLHHTSLSF